MEQEKKTAPQERGAVHYTLANLFDWNDKTIASVAEAMDEDFTTVMSWICGKVPESYQTIKLARVLGCKLTEVYKAILDTPNLIDPRVTDAEDSGRPLPET